MVEEEGYNREDLWQFPRQPGGGGTAMMAPYYIIMRLPGEPRWHGLPPRVLAPHRGACLRF